MITIYLLSIGAPLNQPSVHKGFVLSSHSLDHSDQSTLVLWVVTDQQPARLVIEQEQPVFFIAAEDLQQAELYLKKHKTPFSARHLSLKTFNHQPVAALYFTSIRHARQAAERLQAAGIMAYENDIRLQDRFLMERFVYGSLSFTGTAKQQDGYLEYQDVHIRSTPYNPEFQVLSLDLECAANGELYSIGLHGNTISEVLMIGEPEITTAGFTIHWLDNEKQLLLTLAARLAEIDPDIIIGWNVINFDFRLLVKRAQYHQLKLKLGRGQQPVSWRTRRDDSNQGFITVPGRMVIDGIDALKAATYTFDSFSLEHVARTLLGKGKDTEDVANRMATITHDFHHNKQKLARYNLEDCRLVSAIFKQTRLLDYLCLRTQLTGLALDRQGGSVQAFTNLYLPKLHRAGYIAPNLPPEGGLTSPGGYVMNSLPGLYHNVLVLDFKSLYPSIIRTFKIDPLGLIEGLQHPDNAIPGYRGAVFSRDTHFLPDIITSLWQQRDVAKQAQDSARSQAIKILMNSFYGVLGSGGCRFYDPRLASSITLRGHDIMKQTAQWIEVTGHKVIYGDTDSIFVLLDEHLNHDEADQIGKNLVTDINHRWKRKLQQQYALECHLELEYETHYRRFLMPTIRGAETGSKKRYAGIKVTHTDEQLIFKGLETVRSDWTTLAKNFQTTLYQQVFADQSPEQLIRDTVQQTLTGDLNDQLVYRKRLRRPLNQYTKNIPPHVRAARNADELNRQQGKPLQYQQRGWISYIITLKGPEAIEHQQSPVDHQHYIEKQLKPVADGILPFIGLDFDEIVDGQLGLF